MNLRSDICLIRDAKFECLRFDTYEIFLGDSDSDLLGFFGRFVLLLCKFGEM